MEDKDIIVLYWKRSEEAVRETEVKYGSFLRMLSYRILHNREDAEECENDTLTAAWNTIPPTRPDSLKAYLGRIVRNLSLDRYTYYKAGKRNRELDVLLSELEECLSADNQVEEAFEAGELAAMINGFLQSVKQENRVIFVRRYWYADSVKTIASLCRISEGKVKTVLFRMRMQLKEYLEERGVRV